MRSIKPDLVRLFLFMVLTIVEIILAIFLLFYGSEALKPFAIFLLIVQLLSLHNIYKLVSSLFSFSRR